MSESYICCFGSEGFHGKAASALIASFFGGYRAAAVLRFSDFESAVRCDQFDSILNPSYVFLDLSTRRVEISAVRFELCRTIAAL